LYNIKVAIRKNIKTNGNNTKIHDTIGAPDLQIRFSNQVQNTIYNTLIINTIALFGTGQLYSPTQYIELEFTFCIVIITNEITDITK
jgi:hypothetical protein